MKRILKDHWFYAALGIGLWVIYGNLFRLDMQIMHDDWFVIEPMRSIQSFSEYWAAFQAGKVIDVQPMRDLVTWLNFQFLNLFSISAFHLTNVLIWLSVVLGFRRILLLLNARHQWFVNAFVVGLAFSPIYVGSVAWLTARKHLLASAFIVWATVLLIQKVKEKDLRFKTFIPIYFLFLLAVLSQPIILLWPVWAAFYIALNLGWRKSMVLIPGFVIMLAGVVINQWYYSGPYLAHSYGLSKYSSALESAPMIRLFLFGRYLFQLLIPYWTNIVNYEVGSVKNLIGLLMMPGCFYVFIKLLGTKRVLIWSSFSVLLVAPVVIRMTQIFGNDTYILTAGLGIYVLLYFSIESVLSLHSRWPKVVKVGSTILILSFLLISKDRAMAWMSSKEMFLQHYELEGERNSGIRYAQELQNEGAYDQASVVAWDLYSIYPEDPSIQGLLAGCIVQNPKRSTAEKIDDFFKLKLFKGRALVYLGLLEYDYGNYQNSFDLFVQAVKSGYAPEVFGRNPELIAANLLRSCFMAKQKNCMERSLQEAQTNYGPAIRRPVVIEEFKKMCTGKCAEFLEKNSKPY